MTIYNQENKNCPKPCPPVPPCPPFPPIPPVPPVPPTPPVPLEPIPVRIVNPINAPVFASYYALAPSDNPNPIAATQAVAFPSIAGTMGGISQTSPTTFSIATPGVYQVSYNVNSSTPGQLQIELNGTPLANTVTGTSAANGTIVGHAIVTTTVPNSTIRIINPAGNTNSVTVTPNAGGIDATASQLTIVKLA